jgi:hypothetical protein
MINIPGSGPDGARRDIYRRVQIGRLDKKSSWNNLLGLPSSRTEKGEETPHRAAARPTDLVRLGSSYRRFGYLVGALLCVSCCTLGDHYRGRFGRGRNG